MSIYKIFVFAFVLFTVAACGIKPKGLTPPSAKTDKEMTFPRTYPDPSLSGK